MKDVQISEDALEDLNHGYLFYEVQEAGWVSTLQPAFGQTSRG